MVNQAVIGWVYHTLQMTHNVMLTTSYIAISINSLKVANIQAFYIGLLSKEIQLLGMTINSRHLATCANSRILTSWVKPGGEREWEREISG